MAPPTYCPHASDFLLHLAEHHLAKVVAFGVGKGDENADPASLLTLAPHGIDVSYSSSYLSKIIPNFTLPIGQMLQFPLSQSYSIARNSFPKPIFVASLHYYFVLPLSSFKAVREYTDDVIRTRRAIVKPLFEKHRYSEREEEKCTSSSSELRYHGMYGRPPTHTGGSSDSSQLMFVR